MPPDDSDFGYIDSGAYSATPYHIRKLQYWQKTSASNSTRKNILFWSVEVIASRSLG